MKDNMQESKPEAIQEDTVANIYTDIIRQQLSNSRRLIIALVIVSIIAALSLSANGLLIYERFQYEKVTETSEYSYQIDGEGNVVNGDQYNDNAVHNSNGENKNDKGDE